MLHMVVANHGPDTCATVVPDVAEIASAGFRQITKVSKKLGITIEGAWTHMPGHVIYFLAQHIIIVLSIWCQIKSIIDQLVQGHQLLNNLLKEELMAVAYV